MVQPLQTEQIASFAINARYEQLSGALIAQLKNHLLDSVASLIHSFNKATIQKQVKQLKYFKSTGPCRVPLLGTLPVDRAAQLYTALIRYPDFMDNFLGKHATCHPSDNIGALLAVCQLKETPGKDFLLAMAIAYEIECRLIEEIPVMEKGFDHTSLLLSIAAAAGRIQQYTQDEIAHALAIAGATFNPLITTRAAPTSEWKGLASSFAALGVINILMLAKEGITGPLHLFEGPEGYAQIHGMKLEYDWSKENFELIPRCILKKYNAEVHSQSSLEALMELLATHPFKAEDVKSVEVTTFLTAYHIIGGGDYGDRHTVHTKEQADHSLPYLVAVAILDGQVMPEQFTPERINRSDVQELLQKVQVRTKFPLATPRSIVSHFDTYTVEYPDKIPSEVEIHLNDGTQLKCRKDDYPGFFTRPLGWDDVVKKFLAITNGIISPDQQSKIIENIHGLENHNANSLANDLADLTGDSIS